MSKTKIIQKYNNFYQVSEKITTRRPVSASWVSSIVGSHSNHGVAAKGHASTPPDEKATGPSAVSKNLPERHCLLQVRGGRKTLR